MLLLLGRLRARVLQPLHHLGVGGHAHDDDGGGGGNALGWGACACHYCVGTFRLCVVVLLLLKSGVDSSG